MSVDIRLLTVSVFSIIIFYGGICSGYSFAWCSRAGRCDGVQEYVWK